MEMAISSESASGGVEWTFIADALAVDRARGASRVLPSDRRSGSPALIPIKSGTSPPLIYRKAAEFIPGENSLTSTRLACPSRFPTRQRSRSNIPTSSMSAPSGIHRGSRLASTAVALRWCCSIRGRRRNANRCTCTSISACSPESCASSRAVSQPSPRTTSRTGSNSRMRLPSCNGCCGPPEAVRRGGAGLAVKCHNRTRCTFFVRTLSRLSSCGAERDCVSLDPGWGLGWAGHSFARYDVRSVCGWSRLRKIRHVKTSVAWCPPGLRSRGPGTGARAESGWSDQCRDSARAARPDAGNGPERPGADGVGQHFRRPASLQPQARTAARARRELERQRGRQNLHIQAQEGRDLARRQALHRRRRAVLNRDAEADPRACPQQSGAGRQGRGSRRLHGGVHAEAAVRSVPRHLRGRLDADGTEASL